MTHVDQNLKLIKWILFFTVKRDCRRNFLYKCKACNVYVFLGSYSYIQRKLYLIEKG